MITITRRQARRLRVVFRRHALGLNPKGAVPPLVLVAEPDAGLRVRFQATGLAVEFLLPGQPAAAATRRPAAGRPGRDRRQGRLARHPRERPRATRSPAGTTAACPAPATTSCLPLGDLPPSPSMPTSYASCPGELLAALAEAHATTDEGSSRYALGLIQLRGDTGEVAATDGHQLLVQGGFRFPWRGDVLVRGVPLFAARELPRDRPIEVGRTDTHVVLRTESLVIALGLHPDARFPRVDQVLPAESSATTRLRLDPDDRAFLARSLDGLPGGEAEHAPITLDLNGRIGVRARDPVGGRTTELVLARSRYDGPAVRVAMDRRFLARALQLGTGDFRSPAPISPWRSAKDAASMAGSRWGPRGPSGPTTMPSAWSRRARRTRKPASRRAPAEAAARREAPQVVRVRDREERPLDGGLSSVIQEARELRDALGQAQSRAGRLVAALRKQRSRGRLVQDTLRSLRQLRLQDVAG